MRALALIITSPIWLLAGFFCALIVIPFLIVWPIVVLCEYGFTGRWDWG